LTVNKYQATLHGMTTSWDDGTVLPALLRAARATYGRSIRAALSEAGLDDLPHNAAFVLGGLTNRGGTLGELTRQLGVTKQAASQLIDTLVIRGYLSRSPDLVDRRRMAVTLTDRGRDAASLVRGAVQSVDTELAVRLRADELTALRAGLGALIGIGSPFSGGSSGGSSGGEEDRPPATTRPTRFVPIFPVRHLGRALAHYAGLGFQVESHQEGDEYGFADRDGGSLHLVPRADLDPLVGAGAAYLYLADADQLAREWARPGIGGRTTAPTDTDYRLREGAHIDPDNNLIRFGSPLAGQADGEPTPRQP
jgi:DNA-binding MarR family transcriptional regulator